MRKGAAVWAQEGRKEFVQNRSGRNMTVFGIAKDMLPEKQDEEDCRGSSKELFLAMFRMRLSRQTSISVNPELRKGSGDYPAQHD